MKSTKILLPKDLNSFEKEEQLKIKNNWKKINNAIKHIDTNKNHNIKSIDEFLEVINLDEN